MSTFPFLWNCFIFSAPPAPTDFLREGGNHRFNDRYKNRYNFLTKGGYPPSVKKFVGAGGAEIIKQFQRNWKVDM